MTKGLLNQSSKVLLVGSEQDNERHMGAKATGSKNKCQQIARRIATNQRIPALLSTPTRIGEKSVQKRGGRWELLDIRSAIFDPEGAASVGAGGHDPLAAAGKEESIADLLEWLEVVRVDGCRRSRDRDGEEYDEGDGEIHGAPHTENEISCGAERSRGWEPRRKEEMRSKR